MRLITVRGVDAQYSTEDGWRCHDALAERHLRATCSPEPPNEAEAIRRAQEEFGAEAVADLGDPPAPEKSYTQQIREAEAAKETATSATSTAPAAGAAWEPVAPGEVSS